MSKKKSEESVPTIDDVCEAAQVIKDYCESRNEDESCIDCPIKDICGNEPYLWNIDSIKDGIGK